VIYLTTLSVNESASQYRSDILRSMHHLRDEIDDIIETIEILSDKELLEGIKKSMKDLKSGNIHELSDINDIDELWGNE
jgi:hypothetical protein